MLTDEINETPPSYAPCSAVRITPYTDDRPDPDQAVTYRFDKPITFVHAYRTRVPYLGTTLGHDEHQMPGLVGFAAPIDYEEADTAHALAQKLWQRRGTFVAVDLWLHVGAGYVHALAPAWAWADLGEHPNFGAPPGHHAVTYGECRPAPWPVRWSHSDPSQAAYDIDRGVRILLSVDHDPPPADFPAPN